MFYAIRETLLGQLLDQAVFGRTALLALPVAQEVLQSIMQAWQHKSHDQEVGSFHFWFSANIEQFDAALLRLAQAMRGRQ